MPRFELRAKPTPVVSSVKPPEARRDRFGLGFDFIWSDLGIGLAPEVEFADFTVDVRQLITEGFVFYRAASGGRADNPAHLDVVVGMRYTGTRSRLTAQTGAGVEFDGEFRELSCVDGLAGLRFRAPLGPYCGLRWRVVTFAAACPSPTVPRQSRSRCLVGQRLSPVRSPLDVRAGLRASGGSRRRAPGRRP